MMIMIVQKAIGVTDPVVMCIHVLKEVQEKEAVVIGLLFKHNAPYESTSRKSSYRYPVRHTSFRYESF
jgi:hypothetical protein